MEPDSVLWHMTQQSSLRIGAATHTYLTLRCSRSSLAVLRFIKTVTRAGLQTRSRFIRTQSFATKRSLVHSIASVIRQRWSLFKLLGVSIGERYDSIRPSQPARPFNYPVDRGTYFPVENNEALLWTQGSVRGIHIKNKSWNVYKEGTLAPTPSPILVRRFTGQGGWHETCLGILGLTKMDWNNNTLYKKMPVTLVYSKAFANIVQQNPRIVDNVFDFRYFM